MEQTNDFSSVSVAAVKRRSVWPIIIILVIAAVIAYLWFSGAGGLVGGLFGSSANGSYQAVFLDNNQVYFGQLTNLNQDYATLADIFYLQVAQPLQPSEPANNVNLIKLGAELHGPADKMAINRDHILFIEDLREDSQVVQAIKQYKQQQTSGQ